MTFIEFEKYLPTPVILPGHQAAVAMGMRGLIAKVTNMSIEEDTIWEFIDLSQKQTEIDKEDALAQKLFGANSLSLKKAQNLPDGLVKLHFSAKDTYVPQDPKLYAKMADELVIWIEQHPEHFAPGAEIVCVWSMPVVEGVWRKAHIHKGTN